VEEKGIPLDPVIGRGGMNDAVVTGGGKQKDKTLKIAGIGSFCALLRKRERRRIGGKGIALFLARQYRNSEKEGGVGGGGGKSPPV